MGPALLQGMRVFASNRYRVHRRGTHRGWSGEGNSFSPTWTGLDTAQERVVVHAAALAFASRLCGTSVHLPSPSKRQPW